MSMICGDCKGDFPPDGMSVEHIVPQDWMKRHWVIKDNKNIRLVCKNCNSGKGNELTKEALELIQWSIDNNPKMDNKCITPSKQYKCVCEDEVTPKDRQSGFGTHKHRWVPHEKTVVKGKSGYIFTCSCAGMIFRKIPDFNASNSY